MSSDSSVLIVVPAYNHAATLRQVVAAALPHGPVLVVDDGSTDMTPARLTFAATDIAPHGAFDDTHPLHDLPVHYTRHERNLGKGRAILTGASIARQARASHIVTVDADGQHDPADIPLFLEALMAHPLVIFVGKRDFSATDIPVSSRFGRAFSNFWFRVQTGREVGDSQSGFRAYPLTVLDNLLFTESHYSFEIEVLVRAVWAGFSVEDIPVRVYYPPAHERVSHFRPFMDNLRLTILNTRLTIRAIVPVPQRQFVQDKEGKITVLYPLRSLRLLLCRNETPKNLALSGALGIFIGTLPIFGLHSITILLVLGYFKYNKIMGLAVSQLCMPPFIPALCIEVGYYLRQGEFLTEISWQTLGREGIERICEWILGSLLMAPLLAVFSGVIIFILAWFIRRGLTMEGTP